MESFGYYKVTVKVGVEQENGKIKNHKEIYLVKDAGSPQAAADRVQSLFSPSSLYEWRIESVKAEKIDDILSCED